MQDKNYIRLLPANRYWARFKFITAFVDRRKLLNSHFFLFKPFTTFPNRHFLQRGIYLTKYVFSVTCEPTIISLMLWDSEHHTNL
jgi:hypothetical protein